MSGRLKNESGFALILTLILTVLMVTVVVEMIHQVYVDTSLSRGFRDGQQASILAESGVTGGIKLLQSGLSGRSYTALSDRWATPLKLDDEVGELEIAVSEESAKININDIAQSQTLEMLKRLGKRLQLSEEIWPAVVDWIDNDDTPLSGGAESAYYHTLKPPYSARNSKLLSVSELSLIKGFTPEIVGRLRPYLTLYSDQANMPLATVNINTASKEILAALDERIDERMAEQIIERRRLQPFKDPSELSKVSGMEVIAIGLGGRISVKGNLFKITATARVKDTAREVAAIVRLSAGTAEIMSWQEY